MYKNYITLSGIIDRLLRRPILKDLSEDEAIDYVVDIIGLIGSNSLLTKQIDILDVENYRVAIPNQCVSLEHVRYVVTDDTMGSVALQDRLPMRPASGTYHISRPDTNEYYQKMLTDATYDIRGNIIYTSFPEGKIEICYYSLATAPNGEILLPDDVNVIKAVENYIAYRHIEPLWEIGKIPDKVYNKIEQEYCWYVAKAQSSSKELNLAEREALSDQLTTLIDNRDHRGEFYQNTSLQEFKIRHK